MSIQNYCLCCGTALACIKCNVARAPSAAQAAAVRCPECGNVSADCICAAETHHATPIAAQAQEDCPACGGVGDMFGGFACDQCGGTGKQSTRDSAAARVQAFVDAFENRRGLDPEEIYPLGTADEPLVLSVADLRALLRT